MAAILQVKQVIGGDKVLLGLWRQKSEEAVSKTAVFENSIAKQLNDCPGGARWPLHREWHPYLPIH
jgi:hypothetical protein